MGDPTLAELRMIADEHCALAHGSGVGEAADGPVDCVAECRLDRQVAGDQRASLDATFLQVTGERIARLGVASDHREAEPSAAAARLFRDELELVAKVVKFREQLPRV